MAEALVKRKLVLEGLDCANCAMKIEKGIGNLEGVSSCSVNFATKTMVLETEKNKEGHVVTEAKQLVTKLEPHIKVREEQNKKSVKEVLVLNGLDCANCALKIETNVKEMPGISTATVDFVSKKLKIEVTNKKELETVVANVEHVVHKLEPDVKVVREGKKEHHHDHSHGEGNVKKMIVRLAIGGGLTAAALAGLPQAMSISLFIIAYLLIGGEIVWRAVRNIARGQVFDENFLMAVATLGAFAIGEYPEAVAVMLFYQVGELFQSIAVNRSRKSITSLMDIRPEYANVKVGNETKQVSPEDVQIGDYIIVKPGEKVPLDGKVIEGTSMVDTSALTGESVPREVEVGNEVLSGFVNQNGVLTIEVTKEFEESTVSKILDLVQNASSRKAPTENFITKFARYYTPVVVITAAVLAFIPPLILEGATFSEWIYRALVFLVISCPCALVVSIPLGFFGGIGGASKSGILVKGSNYLEALNDVQHIVFDKTGTLTKGVFKVTKMEPAGTTTKEELLEYAAFAEVYSNHPIAQSIRNAYRKSVDEKNIEDYNEISGHGTVVKVNGKEIFAGNAKLMKKENIEFQQPETVGTLVHVAVDGRYAGYIVISDEVKEDSKQAIQKLKELGIKKTVMLTGDAKRIGEAVGKELGLDEVHAELLPEQKVEEIEKIAVAKQSKEKVAFVGDGINDTPVLARADVGIAMGGLGSDAAIEAADIVIMTDEPSKIATAIKIAKRTRSVVWQNIIFALGVKGLVLLLGAFGIATMWEAVFSDVGVTLIAVLNAMRALRVKNL
ncbi:heavy metal translocating P-type ATPase [Bacillus cytotoxicus]|uniref:Cd(2+)-exporting ATPase n=2 Tax=Bacillus cytotoxicus TaxID=580165 RepID=A0AAX2CCS7_9BACI|nr:MULTISPECIES: heavy metal translocating P-type ATPase [Bacillus cereus group]ABS20865.1 heavy metal translocating P-type ATPase [Bacillus cytotoxicus NVH 391-98]AWC43603.1 cadmium-translocating P-type ATPase [Bacillus cytotoxicus]MDH2864865.1 cadmium-translocating P-type ATPase [Bacillus cytotoxicus]MDH2884828.1 cadmium-translocating P-type ATPase [Bacillus cytotoxicus]MDH2888927.1 cadmium-translocating P-type ATPase [Bacillus cytotoxicus]